MKNKKYTITEAQLTKIEVNLYSISDFVMAGAKEDKNEIDIKHNKELKKAWKVLNKIRNKKEG